MAKDNLQSWQLNRQINISVLVQLVFLASLIVGSWVNLQRQLDLLQHDVTILLQNQKNFAQKLESLSAKSISYEYRLRAIEKVLTKADTAEKTFWSGNTKGRYDEKDYCDTNFSDPFISWL